MRLFTGISICPEVINHLSRLLDHLRPKAQIKWSPVYNLHITTRFIGEWPEDRAQELIDKLRAMTPHEPIDVSVNGLGWLPNPHHPSLLFAAVRPPDALAQLSKAISEELLNLGLPADPRPFFPHITLARIKEAHPVVELKNAIAALPSVDFG
ncbi:MAG: RNA 2',3'-cyclic phosphodiesterase, partial [Bryobacteraceae bacterium]